MTDQGYREIQLGGKQLVFLFMASLVLAVAIFLLGVSVGRGVRDAGVNADTAAPAVETASTEQTVLPEQMPPATTVTPQDQAYHDQLQEGRTPPPSAPPPPASVATPAPEPPTPAGDAPPVNNASAAPAAVRTPVPATTKPAPAAITAPKPPAPAPVARGGQNWVAQVGVFGTRANADRLVTQLKAKGFAAYAEPTTGTSNRVVVGPFSDRAEADQAAARLRAEGFQPLVRR